MLNARGWRSLFDKQLLLGISAAALLAPVSAEAQRYQAPGHGWQGAYAGVHAGYGWGSSDVCVEGVCGSLDTGGAIGGGQIGYNWTVGGFLLGVEGDVSFSGIDGDAFFGGKNPKSDLDWMATVRGRAGAFVFDNVLLYGTAGVAWGDWNNSFVPIATTNRFSETYTGYTVGGGVETRISQNVSVKLEYLFVDFGEESHRWTDVGNTSGTADFDHQIHTIRLGVNFKLN